MAGSIAVALSAMVLLRRYPGSFSAFTRGQAVELLYLPKVTVIINNYNYADFIEAAFTSAVEQTYPNTEVIIVDDCSTDDSVSVIGRLTASKPDVKVLLLDRNQGQPKACLAALNICSGSYVVFLDSDDQLLPRCVEAHIFSHLSSRVPIALSSVDTINHVAGQDVNFSQAGFTQFIADGSGRKHGLLRSIDKYLPDTWFSERTPVVALEQIHFVMPPHADPWVWAPSSAICYRVDAVRMLLKERALVGVKWIDTFLARPLSALFGSILIDAPLMRYVTHASNNFVRGAPINNYLMFSIEQEALDCRALTVCAIEELIRSSEKFAEFYTNKSLYFQAIRELCESWPGMDEVRGSHKFYSELLHSHQALLIGSFGRRIFESEVARVRPSRASRVSLFKGT